MRIEAVSVYSRVTHKMVTLLLFVTVFASKQTMITVFGERPLESPHTMGHQFPCSAAPQRREMIQYEIETDCYDIKIFDL